MSNDSDIPTPPTKTEMLQICLLAFDRMLVFTEHVAENADKVVEQLKDVAADARDARRELEGFLGSTGDLPDPSTRLGA